jgi:hypothetical protein
MRGIQLLFRSTQGHKDPRHLQHAKSPRGHPTRLGHPHGQRRIRIAAAMHNPGWQRSDSPRPGPISAQRRTSLSTPPRVHNNPIVCQRARLIKLATALT